MSNDFDKLANDLLNPANAAKLSGKKKDIHKLVTSPDGKKIKEMIGGDVGSLKKAVAEGDMTTLQRTLSGLLKTDEGARLAKQISEMMK